MSQYIHGYSERESQRLLEQSEILEKILHEGTCYEPYSNILEAGCGVGGQTVILARRNPDSFITSVDISEESLQKAKQNCEGQCIVNVRFQQADIMQLPFPENSFDHIFVCFLLEHLSNPLEALIRLKKNLKPNGTITVIEGDHEACIWYPYTEASEKTWKAMIKSQQLLGHDPNIGRKLYPLLKNSGYKIENIAPCWAYTDAGRPVIMNSAINKIIVPMAQTARKIALEKNLIDEKTWNQGIVDFENVALNADGTFFYTWFKGLGKK